MKSEIKDAISDMTRNFLKELGVNRSELDGLKLVGSNASYTWTPDSDMDITMYVSPDSSMSRKRFKALSKLTSILNYELSPSIKGIPTNFFLSLRGLNNPIRNQSVYNLMNQSWEQEPAHIEERDPKLIHQKVQELVNQIRTACDSDDLNCQRKLLSKIKGYRAKALKRGGEESFGAQVYRKLQRDGEIGKLTEHLKQLKKMAFTMEQTGQLPQREEFAQIPLKETSLSFAELEKIEEYGKPTNQRLWEECLAGAERLLPFVHRTIQVAEAINHYTMAKGRWYSDVGQPCYLNIDIDVVKESVGGEDSSYRRMTSNFSSRILSEMASRSSSRTSYKVLSEVAQRGDKALVGTVLQECLNGEGGVKMHCGCHHNHLWYMQIRESMYRGTKELPEMMDRLFAIEDILMTLEG